jgi:hypothetical protein
MSPATPTAVSAYWSPAGIGSASAARPGGAWKGSAKYWDSWVIMNPGGGPTPDKPDISVVDHEFDNTVRRRQVSKSMCGVCSVTARPSSDAF